MSKYIKSFNSAAELISYYQTAEGKKYYTLMNTAGEEGIGTSITSGKKIISAYKSKYDYLTFTAVEAGATVKYNNLANTTAEYSTDGGITWNNGVGVTVTLSNIGDSVKYRGVISANLSVNNERFTFNSKKISASGSIMSMYNNNPDDTEIVYAGAFTYMFYNRSSLIAAPELPATTLSERCYERMFWGCTSLTEAPMLPATSLVKQCYNEMFNNCKSLTTAPELPATTLANYCYNSMFKNCKSLTTAPELPATTLTNSCYTSMFNGCSSLTSVTHHITNWNASNTNGWLNGVAATGTVKCPANSTIPSNSTDGIPSGWTRENL